MRTRLALLLIAALALGACSSSSDPSTVATSPSAASSASGSAAPTGTASPADVSLADGVAATVGETDVPAAELQARVDLAQQIPQISQQVEQADDPQAATDRLQAQLLSQLVLQELVLQQAATDGVEISDKQLADERASVTADAGGEDALATRLASAAVPPDQLDAQLRFGLALNMITQQRLAASGDASPSASATPSDSASPTDTASPTPEEQRVQREFLQSAVDAIDVAVDSRYGS